MPYLSYETGVVCVMRSEEMCAGAQVGEHDDSTGLSSTAEVHDCHAAPAFFLSVCTHRIVCTVPGRVHIRVAAAAGGTRVRV